MVRVRPNENVECPICIQDIKYAVETSCGHMFCGSCTIEVWRSSNMRYSFNCPLCRRQVTLLLTCFTQEETNAVHETEIAQRERIISKLNQYNRLQMNESRSIWTQFWDLPVLLRHIWAELFTAEGLAYVSKIRILLLFLFGFIYVIVPIDLIPEAVLGIFGLMDDFLVTVFVLIQAAVIYREHASNPIIG